MWWMCWTLGFLCNEWGKCKHCLQMILVSPVFVSISGWSLWTIDASLPRLSSSPRLSTGPRRSPGNTDPTHGTTWRACTGVCYYPYLWWSLRSGNSNKPLHRTHSHTPHTTPHWGVGSTLLDYPRCNEAFLRIRRPLIALPPNIWSGKWRRNNLIKEILQRWDPPGCLTVFVFVRYN